MVRMIEEVHFAQTDVVVAVCMFVGDDVMWFLKNATLNTTGQQTRHPATHHSNIHVGNLVRGCLAPGGGRRV